MSNIVNIPLIKKDYDELDVDTRAKIKIIGDEEATAVLGVESAMSFWTSGIDSLFKTFPDAYMLDNVRYECNGVYFVFVIPKIMLGDLVIKGLCVCVMSDRSDVDLVFQANLFQESGYTLDVGYQSLTVFNESSIKLKRITYKGNLTYLKGTVPMLVSK